LTSLRPREEDLNAIFRAAHSTKGGAATFGLTDLTDVTHVLESLLDRIRKGEMALTSEHVDAFLAAKDILKMQLDGHRLHTPVDQDAVADVRMMLQSLSQDAIAPAARPVPRPVRVRDDSDRAKAHYFRIELPQLPARDVDALEAELGMLGPLAKTALDDKRFVFMLATDETADDIIAICSFVLDPDDLKVTGRDTAEYCPGEHRCNREVGAGTGLWFFRAARRLARVYRAGSIDCGRAGRSDRFSKAILPLKQVPAVWRRKKPAGAIATKD